MTKKHHRFRLERYAAFHDSKAGDTTFLSEQDPIKFERKINDCRASKVYVHKDVLRDNVYVHGTLIPVKNPKLEFVKDMISAGGADYAADLDNNNSNNNNTDSIIEYGHSVNIGKNTTIGMPALSTIRDEEDNNKIYRFPHIGKVKIGDDVWIGSNVQISRGVLCDTIIEHNVTIDCHVHIAHNCVIGYNTQIAAGAIIGGSVRIGHDCWIGLNATIRDHAQIGNHVLVAQGANVTKDVPDYDVVAGNPAKSIKDVCKLTDDKLFQYVGYRRKPVK